MAAAVNDDNAPRWHRCLIALGANRGDTGGAVRGALTRLDAHEDANVLRTSSLFRTAPIGGPPGQGDFINAAVCLETVWEADEMLRHLLHIEREMGRERVERWGPRVIDLDLLLYDDLVTSVEGLQIPHPRMSFRRFVLEPAAEAAPEMVHPTIEWTMQQLCEHLDHSPFFLEIVGADAPRWVEKIAAKFDGVRLKGNLGGEPDSILQQIEQLQQGAERLIVGDDLPPLPPRFRPRLVALLPDVSIEQAENAVGPRLELQGEDAAIETDLFAAVEAMR